MRKTISVVLIFLFVITIFSGCGVLGKFGLGEQENDELQPASSIAIGEDEARKLSDKVPIHLYFANADNSKLMLEVRFVKESEAKKSVNNLAGIVVKELIAGPTKSGLVPTIPKDTKLKTKVSIKDGTATVNLSKDFVNNHPGGKEAERITIYSLVNSLTEIKDIQNVRFKINGEVKETYKGSFKFDVPFPRNISLINTESVLQVPSATVQPTPTSKANKADSEAIDVAGSQVDETYDELLE